VNYPWHFLLPLTRTGSTFHLKAIIATNYGGPERLQLKEVDKPSPGANEVLVKVFAVAINDWDWALLQGDFVNRLLNGFSKPRRQIFGSDVAGRVEAVGKKVTRFRVGDEVFGDLSGSWGGFAEYVCADENALAHKPAVMSFEQAASIPQAGMLAVQGLIDAGRVKSGEKVLLNGAGGGVGTFALQILKPLGVEVTAVDTAEKLAMLRNLGAEHTLDYKMRDFTKTGARYDLILDTKTNRSPLEYLRALIPGCCSVSRISPSFQHSRTRTSPSWRSSQTRILNTSAIFSPPGSSSPSSTDRTRLNRHRRPSGFSPGAITRGRW
jgi:NADPH:quinone reductase-like Zn-dependent oxidoreductase